MVARMRDIGPSSEESRSQRKAASSRGRVHGSYEDWVKGRTEKEDETDE